MAGKVAVRIARDLVHVRNEERQEEFISWLVRSSGRMGSKDSEGNKWESRVGMGELRTGGILGWRDFEVEES